MLFERKISEIKRNSYHRKTSNNINNINDNNNKLLEKFPNNYKNCRFILLDTETTGLDITIDRLISINAIEMINGELTGIQFNAYLNKRFKESTMPLMYYLSDYNYSRKDNIKKSLETFLSFVSDSIIITHNALFDMKFINEELKRWSLPEIPLSHCICTLKILKNLKKIGRLDKNFKLRLCDLCRYYNIYIKQKDLHQGIVDVIVFGRVVSKMFEDGIYNDYDNYDYEESNSFINCTHVDISCDFENLNRDINKNINKEEETDSRSESIDKQKKSKSEEKIMKNKIIHKNNLTNFKKKRNKNINKNINFFKNKNSNKIKKKKILINKENNINNINNNDTIYDSKKKLYKSFVLNEKDNFQKIVNQQPFSSKILSESTNINIEYKEEQKINFIKNAFKCYIKGNKQGFKKK